MKKLDATEIYTIGIKSSECYGHGDYGTETKICKDGVYGSGSYPPCFIDRTEAEKYLKKMRYIEDAEIVTLYLYK